MSFLLNYNELIHFHNYFSFFKKGKVRAISNLIRKEGYEIFFLPEIGQGREKWEMIKRSTAMAKKLEHWSSPFCLYIDKFLTLHWKIKDNLTTIFQFCIAIDEITSTGQILEILWDECLVMFFCWCEMPPNLLYKFTP